MADHSEIPDQIQLDSTWESPIGLLSVSPIVDEWPANQCRTEVGFMAVKIYGIPLRCIMCDFKISLSTTNKYFPLPLEL